MALSINELKSGMTVLVDNQVYSIIEYQHVKPGKGSAFVRTKLRNLKLDTVQEKTFRESDKIDEAYVEEKKLQYQYRSGDMCHFMDRETFEDVTISQERIGEPAKFLKDNLEVSAYYYKDDLLNVALPNFITYKITHSEPGIKGDTAKSGTKPATIETGAIIQVPLFIEVNDTIKVDTRTGQYLERVYT